MVRADVWVAWLRNIDNHLLVRTNGAGRTDGTNAKYATLKIVKGGGVVGAE